MLKLDLTQEELQYIARLKQNSQVHTFLRNKNKTVFSLGDILVRYHKDYEGRVRVETVSRSSNAPRKFKVVFIDEFGLPYVKHVRVDGSLAEGIQSVCDMSLDVSWYEADPDYAEKIILGADANYDPIEQFKIDKEQRKKIKEANRRIREKTNTRTEVRELIEKIMVGTEVWFSDERDVCIHTNERRVISKEELTIMETKQKHAQYWRAEQELDQLKQQYPGSPDKFYILEVEEDGIRSIISEYQFWRKNVFLTRPTSVRGE